MQIDIEQLKEELFLESLPVHLVADLIAAHNPKLKITENVIHSFLKFANDKSFTLDIAVNKIRKLNKFNEELNGKIIYHLEDGSRVAISEDTLEQLQHCINNNDIIKFMNINKQNFCGAVGALEE